MPLLLLKGDTKHKQKQIIMLMTTIVVIIVKIYKKKLIYFEWLERLPSVTLWMYRCDWLSKWFPSNSVSLSKAGFKTISKLPSASSSSWSLTWSLSYTIKVLHAKIIQITATEMNAETLLEIAEFVYWLYAVIDFPSVSKELWLDSRWWQA